MREPRDNRRCLRCAIEPPNRGRVVLLLRFACVGCRFVVFQRRRSGWAVDISLLLERCDLVRGAPLWWRIVTTWNIVFHRGETSPCAWASVAKRDDLDLRPPLTRNDLKLNTTSLRSTHGQDPRCFSTSSATAALEGSEPRENESNSRKLQHLEFSRCYHFVVNLYFSLEICLNLNSINK